MNVTDGNVRRSIAEFSPTGGDNYKESVYTFDGIEREDARGTVTLRRNGLLSLQVPLPLFQQRSGAAEAGQHIFAADAMDLCCATF